MCDRVLVTAAMLGDTLRAAVATYSAISFVTVSFCT